MKVINKHAKFDYDILEVLEAGIILSGSEAKSARLGQIDMNNSFVKILDGVPQIINLHIYPYKFAKNDEYEPTRMRKLLVSRKEILALGNKIKQRKLTLVPTAMYTKGPLVKVEIGLARGKKAYEKREVVKKRDLDLDMERELRGSK